MEPTRAAVLQAVLRVERKLDRLIEALGEDADPEADDVHSLDGDAVARERDASQSLG